MLVLPLCLLSAMASVEALLMPFVQKHPAYFVRRRVEPLPPAGFQWSPLNAHGSRWTNLLDLGCGSRAGGVFLSDIGRGFGVAFREWTPLVVSKVALLFLVAGLAEIGGGWLVWQAVREGKPWWWAAMGSVVLVAYGFIPTLQPLSDFGRLYAVYGGIFIGLSYGWGAMVDGMRLDKGDVLGSVLALAGICVALFWPRNTSG